MNTKTSNLSEKETVQEEKTVEGGADKVDEKPLEKRAPEVPFLLVMLGYLVILVAILLAVAFLIWLF